MLSFRAIAKSASAHRCPHLSSHCYGNTHIYRKISAQANPFIDFKLQTLLIRRHQIICFSMSECVGFCRCVCVFILVSQETVLTQPCTCCQWSLSSRCPENAPPPAAVERENLSIMTYVTLNLHHQLLSRCDGSVHLR